MQSGNLSKDEHGGLTALIAKSGKPLYAIGRTGRCAYEQDYPRYFRRLADRLGVSKEELIQFTIGEIIGRPDEDFELALKHVMDKNAELYKRLS